MGDDVNYVSISSGSEGSQSYFYYEAVVDGTWYLSERRGLPMTGRCIFRMIRPLRTFYLSHTGFGSGNAYVWQATNPTQGQWGMPVKVICRRRLFRRCSRVPARRISTTLRWRKQRFLAGRRWALFLKITLMITGEAACGGIYCGRFYKVWLAEDANVLNVRASGWVDLLSSCVGHWKMNDNAASTTVLDSSGNGKNGTLSRTPRYCIPQRQSTVLNGALTFNGTSDYVDVGNVIGTGAYTKVAWVKRDDGSYYNNIISSGNYVSCSLRPVLPSRSSFQRDT